MVAVKELERRKTSLNLLSTEGILMRLRAMEPAERALTFRLLEKEKALEARLSSHFRAGVRALGVGPSVLLQSPV